jgi:cytochrome P450
VSPSKNWGAVSRDDASPLPTGFWFAAGLPALPPLRHHSRREAAMAEVRERAPDLDIDPYDDAFIADPYPGYAAMRSAGPAFYIPKYACWGMARYKEVRPALIDWKTYSSSMGVGYTHFGKEKPWRPPSVLLETDPPLHDRTRRIVDRVVFPPALQRLREPFAKEAAAAVDRHAAATSKMEQFRTAGLSSEASAA